MGEQLPHPQLAWLAQIHPKDPSAPKSLTLPAERGSSHRARPARRASRHPGELCLYCLPCALSPDPAAPALGQHEDARPGTACTAVLG